MMNSELGGIELDDQLKELLSEILEQGELFIQQPLQGSEIFTLKQRGVLIETILPSGFKYALSPDARRFLSENRDMLKVDYSWASNMVVDYGII